MIKKITNDSKLGSGPIKICYPGSIWGKDDSGVGSIGRIDQANIEAGNTIKMHPHVNDEILSYFRSGEVKHTDSEGFSENITPNKLMLMKAGEIFYHEETVNQLIEGLQIFIRPKIKNSKPQVIFLDLPQVYSHDIWRLIASPLKDTPLQFSSETWIYDYKVKTNTIIELPKFPSNELTGILYVFKGFSKINGTFDLSKGEAIIFNTFEKLEISVDVDSELVLFLTNEAAEYYNEGMYSGNKS